MGETNYSCLDLASTKGDWTGISVISTSDCSWGGITDEVSTSRSALQTLFTKDYTISYTIKEPIVDNIETKPNVYRARRKFRKIIVK